MKRLTTITFVAFVALAAPAHAVTLVNPDGSSAARYQRWADSSLMPTAAETVTIRSGRCHDSKDVEREEVGCTWPGGPVWLDPAWPEAKMVLLHELGHRFDYAVMNDYARDKFRALVGDERPWRTSPNSPHEKFAEAYSLCAAFVRPWAARLLMGGYEYKVTARRHRRICQLIRRAAR